MENLIIYALIAFVLFVIFYKDKNHTEVMDLVHSNYAEYRIEMLVGEDDEH